MTNCVEDEHSQTLRSAIRNRNNLGKVLGRLPQKVKQRVVCVQDESVVEVISEPFLEPSQAPKIYHESVLVDLGGLELKLEGPVVSVDQRTMTSMVRLPMSERKVVVAFDAVEHGLVALHVLFERRLPVGPVLVVNGVPQGVAIGCDVEGFQSLHAGPAFAAGDSVAIVASVGVLKRDLEVEPAADDVGLGFIDKGTEQLDRLEITKAGGLVHRSGELLAAVRVDCVIASMSSVGNNRRPVIDRDSDCESNQDHVPIRDDRSLHRLRRVMPFRNLHVRLDVRPTAAGQSGVAQMFPKRLKVDQMVVDAELFTGDRGSAEFTRMLLSVVHRNGSDQFVARRPVEDIGKNGRVHAAG